MVVKEKGWLVSSSSEWLVQSVAPADGSGAGDVRVHFRRFASSRVESVR